MHACLNKKQALWRKAATNGGESCGKAAYQFAEGSVGFFDAPTTQGSDTQGAAQAVSDTVQPNGHHEQTIFQ